MDDELEWNLSSVAQCPRCPEQSSRSRAVMGSRKALLISGVQVAAPMEALGLMMITPGIKVSVHEVMWGVVQWGSRRTGERI